MGNSECGGLAVGLGRKEIDMDRVSRFSLFSSLRNGVMISDF